MNVLCMYCRDSIPVDDEKLRGYHGLIRCPHCKREQLLKTGHDGQILEQSEVRRMWDGFL